MPVKLELLERRGHAPFCFEFVSNRGPFEAYHEIRNPDASALLGGQDIDVVSENFFEIFDDPLLEFSFTLLGHGFRVPSTDRRTSSAGADAPHL